MNKEFVIYKHTNIINKKIYIGQTCQSPPSKRWYPSNYKNNEYFYSAIQKYGWDNFTHEIIESNLTLEEANIREEYWIKHYDSTNHEQGYNIRSGGNNSLLSEETKNKMSKNHRDVKGEKNYFYGKHFIGELHPFYGKHHTEDSKQKISKSKINKGGLAVKCLETNEVFNTANEAARHCGLSRGTHILDCCYGKRKSAGKHPISKIPLHWAFYNQSLEK